MDRDSRSSNRDRTRGGQMDGRNEYDRPAAPRGAGRAPARNEYPRDGMSPPPRSGALGGTGRQGRPGAPSDLGGRRNGNGNGYSGGSGIIRPPRTANGAPGDDGDESGPRSRPGSAAPGRSSRYDSAIRGGRPGDTPDRGSRAPVMAGARQRGRDDGYSEAERGNSGGRRSMASMARDVSRSMSRQLGAALSRTGRSIRDAGAPPVRGMTPQPSRRVVVPP